MKSDEPLSSSFRLHLDRQDRGPLYRQIYERIRDAITTGTLQPGDRLPSIRSLASQLATARGTIDLAYGMLLDEGFVHSRRSAGTFVASALVGIAERPIARKSGNLPPEAAATTGIPQPPLFQLGLPALDAFPRALWSRLAIKRERMLRPEAMGYSDAFGHMPLRQAISRYLAVSRGVVCDAGQIVITAGFQTATGLIARVLLKPGDAVWVEDPCYFQTPTAMAVVGARIVPVPVDDKGLDVSAGENRCRAARMAIVTPSHQMPLGVAMDLSRRLSLLKWAAENKAWIVEDDYDGEFRYIGKPLPALKSLDQAERVIYAGTFSKVLFPALRLGYLVLPSALAPAFRRVLDALYRDCPTGTQAVVADFMEQGHFARHLRRMRQLYADRRRALSDALRASFGDRLRLQLEAGGMHLLAQLHQDEGDVVLAASANAHGMAVVPLSRLYIDHVPHQGLLLGFTNIAADQAGHAATHLNQALMKLPKIAAAR